MMNKENCPVNVQPAAHMCAGTPMKTPLITVLSGKKEKKIIEIIGDHIYSAKKSALKPSNEEVGYHQVNLKVFEVRLYDSYIAEDSIIATQIAVGSSIAQGGKANEKTIYPSKFTPIYSFNDTIYMKNKKNEDATAFHFTDPLYSTCSFNIKAKNSDIMTSITISNSKGMARNDTIGAFSLLYNHSAADSSLIRCYPVYDIENEKKVIGEIRIKVEYVLDIDFFDDSASESTASQVTTPSTIQSPIRFDSRSPLACAKSPRNGLSPRSRLLQSTPKSGMINLVSKNTATFDISTSPMSPYVPTPVVSPSSTRTTPHSLTKFGNKNMFISPPIKEKKQKKRAIKMLKPIKKNLRNILLVALPLLIFLMKIMLVISFTAAAPASAIAKCQAMHHKEMLHPEHDETNSNVIFMDKFQLNHVLQLLRDEEIMISN